MFSLSPREAGVGREPERGAIQEKNLLSPTLSSLVPREEREKRRDAIVVTGPRRAQSSGSFLLHPMEERTPRTLCALWTQ